MTGFEVLAADDGALRPSSDPGLARRHLIAADVVGHESNAHRQQVLRFITEHADAALRSNTTGHLTGSGVVVDASGQRTALLLHRKLRRWFQPGGHADGDTNLAGVAHREASEETGIANLRVVVPAIDVDIHEVAPPGEQPHLHLDVRYLVMAPPEGRLEANEESLDLRWVSVAELDDLTPALDDRTRQLVRRGMDVARSLRD